MAYFYNNNNYSSNYSEVPDNYQYYYNNQDYYSSNNYDYSRYVPYYDTQNQFHGNAYQLAPTPPLVGYYYSNYIQPESVTSSKNEGDYYLNEPVSTEFVVYHNTKTNGAESEGSDVVFEEYNPKPFNGGYDINEKYGKPMSPNEKICYPPSKSKDEVDPNSKSLGDFSYGDVPNPYVDEVGSKKVESVNEPKQGNGVISAKKVVVEEDDHGSDFDDDDEDEDEDEDEDDYYDDDEDDEDDEAYIDEKGAKEDSSKTAVVAALGDGVVNKKDEEQKSVEDVGKPKDGGEVIQEKKAASDFEANEEEKQGDVGKEEPPKTNQIVPLNEEKEAKNEGVGDGVIQEQKPSNFEGEKIDEGRKEDQIRRQIPPGYGMEALDLCEGLFGGYFPCLWKKKQGNYANNTPSSNNVNQQSGGYYGSMSDYDYDYCCKETVEYLFGNPNPYGGTMPEKGSYGDPMYSYQRYVPQQAVSEQVECYYGYNNGGYYQ